MRKNYVNLCIHPSSESGVHRKLHAPVEQHESEFFFSL